MIVHERQRCSQIYCRVLGKYSRILSNRKLPSVFREGKITLPLERKAKGIVSCDEDESNRRSKHYELVILLVADESRGICEGNKVAEFVTTARTIGMFSKGTHANA